MALGMMSWLFGGVIMMLITVIVSVLAFIFWIIMLVDVIKRDFKKSDERVVWILVVILAGIIGALVYYFVVKRENKH